MGRTGNRMLISEKTKKSLQAAYTEEQNAWKLYLNLSVLCERLGYFGAAKFFKTEASHELEHANKIASLLNDLGTYADSVDTPQSEIMIESLADALQEGYNAEKSLYEKYKAWYDKEDDSGLAPFYHEMIKLQVESVGEYGDWIQRLKQMPNEFLLDQELGSV